MNYVKNAWYVAGWSSEFSHALRRITVLDEHVAVFRAASGAVVALHDRCPHRLLPLSRGKLINDTVQCGYHGLTFDATGQCVRIPGQDTIPDRACVRAYPIIEQHDIVWIWLGAAERATPDALFDFAPLAAPGWDRHQGDALPIESNYLNVAENLIDPAHVSFVHPTTLGNPESEDVPVNVDIGRDVIRAWRWIRNAPPIGFFREFGGFSGNVDRWHYYDLHLPSTAVIDFGSVASHLGLAEDQRDQGVRIFALHFLTPVSATHTIDRWMHIRNTARDDPAVSEKMDALFRVAFAEDKAVLEAIQAEELLPPTGKPFRFAVDKAPNVYRARINKLIEAEQLQTP